MDVIFPETVLEFDAVDDVNLKGVYVFFTPLFYLEPGETYSVVFDGVIYLCEAFDVEGESRCLGNLNLDGLSATQYTEYPFLIASMIEPRPDYAGAFLSGLEGATHTVAIYRGAIPEPGNGDPVPEGGGADPIALPMRLVGQIVKGLRGK